MNIFLLARKRLTYKPVQNGLAIIVMAFSIALAILGLLLTKGLHQGIVTAVEPFPLVLGVKGSPNQLLLNTVFLKDVPIGNFSYQVVEQLRKDKNVSLAIPFGFGDNYKGHRLVGTEAELFNYKIKPSAAQPWLHLTEGRYFANLNEVVLGAKAAQATGLKIGDKLTTIHGVIAHKGAKQHHDQYTIVGILAPVQGPYDDAIFTSLASIWQEHAHNSAEVKKEVTALLVKPSGYAQALILNSFYSKNPQLQLLFPAKQVIELFDMAGGAEKLLSLICLSIIILSLLIISCSLYWVILGNRRQETILRSMGASADLLLRLNFLTGFLLIIAGILFGVTGAHLLYGIISKIINANTSMVLAQSFTIQEVILIAAVLLCGSCCCLLQAYLNKKKDIIELLQS